MDYKLHNRRLNHIVSFPFIWAMIIPLWILDIGLTIYHHVCFRLYNIPLVKRKDYIVYDREALAYLSPLDKLNCAYCSYGNGLLAYAAEIAARTEQYWCAVKHQKKKGMHVLAHHKKFVAFGDEKAYKKRYEQPLKQ